MRTNGMGLVQFGLEFPAGMAEERAIEVARSILRTEGTEVGSVEKADDGVYLIEVDDIFTAKLEGAGEWEGEQDGVRLSAEWP